MPEGSPTEQVWVLRQQGLSNNQIVESLQRDGYPTNQILDAMNQADLREQTKQPFSNTAAKEGEHMQDPNSPVAPQGAPNNMPTQPPTQAPAQAPIQDEYGAIDTGDRVEELVEAVIDEKWKDVVENINRIIDWKEKTESRLAEIDTKIENLKNDFDKLHTAILEKVGEYDNHITDVGTEVQALEKVFQKVLPGFMENVNELSRIADKIKKHT